MKQLPDGNIPWHHLKLSEVAELVETVPASGLDPREAEKRLERFGPNALPVKKAINPLLLFLLQFNNIIIYLLIAIAIFCYATMEWV
jgi:magnesium-transporting ATPase (P-type)